SILSRNTASLRGGGIWNNGTVTVSSSTLSGNKATHGGGGVFNSGGTVALDDSTLSGNSASVGAAILNELVDGGTATVSGCTLTGNIAGIESGSIENRSSDASSLTVRNSTFSGNQPKAIHGAYTDGGGNSGICIS